jgi:hypothetical protein
MQSSKKMISIKQPILIVWLFIAFCIFPLLSLSLNLSCGNDANSSKIEATTWIATQVEKDDDYVHPVLHEMIALIDLNKAFVKVCGCCIHDEKIIRSIFVKSDNYASLYVLQLLKNKDPPERE